mgnify:CR=1 FL=1
MRKKQITICVTCVGGFLTYDFISSLRSQDDFDCKIIGIDQNYSSKGNIICDKFYKVSNQKNERKYINDILKIYKKEKFDIFFPLSDYEALLILKYKKFFSSKKVNFKSGSDQFEISSLFYDKKKFLTFCNEKKIPTGKCTFFNNYKELSLFLKNKRKKRFILKALTGSGTRNVFLINQERKKPIKILESRDCYELNLKDLKKYLNFKKYEYVLMPYYNGEIYDIDCIALNGVIKEFAIRKRQIKNRFLYYSTGHLTIKNNKIRSLIQKIVKETNLTGICDFDVIQYKKRYILLEASCRFSGSVGVSTLSGVNFPAQMVRYLMNLKPKKYKLTINKSFRSFLMLQEIKSNKSRIQLDDYIPHYSKQLSY